jgi:tRNA(fMet)-specific endonuclease VapC
MTSITYAELEYGVAVSANPARERDNLACLIEDIPNAAPLHLFLGQ